MTRAETSNRAAGIQADRELNCKENIVLLGPPGTGKSHLAIALGIRACLAGHRVVFKTATQWVAHLADAKP